MNADPSTQNTCTLLLGELKPRLRASALALAAALLRVTADKHQVCTVDSGSMTAVMMQLLPFMARVRVTHLHTHTHRLEF